MPRKNRSRLRRNSQGLKFLVALLFAFLSGSSAFAQTPHASNRKIRNSKDGLPYVWIPAGSFTMGCSEGDKECFSEEMPAHKVTISKGFWIGQTEVTVAAYEKFAGLTSINGKQLGAQHPSERDSDRPIVVVTWDEARDYCAWADGRLPTEAEWEYAARGGSSANRYGDLDQIAWYQKNSGNSAHAAGSKLPNNYALYDVLGNAWEWVNDWYDGTYYAHSPELDPKGPDQGIMHVMRGGSWMNTENLLRLSDRGRSKADLRFNYFGIRCIYNRPAP